jgi:hypothetical protein
VPFFKGARPNPNFNQITMIYTGLSSTYNAGVFQFNRRMTKGLQFQMNYTIANSRDDATSSGFSPTPSGNYALDPANIGLDRGPSNFDLRQRFAASFVWQPQYFDGVRGPAHVLLSGWTLAGIFTKASGLPYSGTVTGNPPSGLGNAASGVLGSQPSSNRVPFVERNSFRLPGTYDLDMRLARGFRLWERAKLEFLVESFNLFNHVNYTNEITQNYTLGGTAAAPVLTYSSNFGQLTAANNNTVLGPRQIQIGARITF